MRANQSSTASEIDRFSGPFIPHIAAHSAVPTSTRTGDAGTGLVPPEGHSPLACLATCPIEDRREGLLHDAHNLVGALGLYCDLLGRPGVLKPEHRHYADEVRLLGSRSAALIEHLLQPPAQAGRGEFCPGVALPTVDEGKSSKVAVPMHEDAPVENMEDAVQPVSLRSVVQRCAGLLSRVAGGRTIEVSYGHAAAVPVRVPEETVERILVNLVRNATAALIAYPIDCWPAKDAEAHHMGYCAFDIVPGTHGSVRVIHADAPADVTPGIIRIGVGLPMYRVGAARPSPFRGVRLAVEDSGCGMTPEQLQSLLSGGRAPSRSNHGIGFRVVRELVTASGGELRAMSAPGTGTRVQIEWPMAALESGHGAGEPEDAPDSHGDERCVAHEPVPWPKPIVGTKRMGDFSAAAEGLGA